MFKRVIAAVAAVFMSAGVAVVAASPSHAFIDISVCPLGISSTAKVTPAEDYSGAYTNPITSDGRYGAYPMERHTLPEWYGFGTPSLVASWHSRANSDESQIRPEGGEPCSTADGNGTLSVGIPTNIITGIEFFAGVRNGLQDATAWTATKDAEMRKAFDRWVETTPLPQLVDSTTILVLIPAGVLIIGLLIRAAASRGGSLSYQRAMRRIGWTLIAITGPALVITGSAFTVVDTERTIAGEVSTAFTTISEEVLDGAVDAFTPGSSSFAFDACAANYSMADPTAKMLANIQCVDWEREQFRPWLYMQYGTMDINERILPADEATVRDLAGREDGGVDIYLQAVQQVREKYGTYAVNDTDGTIIAPVLQMELLQGDNGDFFGGTDWTPKERLKGLETFHYMVDRSPLAEAWAPKWAQADGGAGNISTAIAALIFAFIASIVGSLLSLTLFLSQPIAFLAVIALAFVLPLVAFNKTRPRAITFIKWCLGVQVFYIFAVLAYSTIGGVSEFVSAFLLGMLGSNPPYLLYSMVASSVYIIILVALYTRYQMRGVAKGVEKAKPVAEIASAIPHPAVQGAAGAVLAGDKILNGGDGESGEKGTDLDVYTGLGGANTTIEWGTPVRDGESGDRSEMLAIGDGPLALGGSTARRGTPGDGSGDEGYVFEEEGNPAGSGRSRQQDARDPFAAINEAVERGIERIETTAVQEQDIFIDGARQAGVAFAAAASSATDRATSRVADVTESATEGVADVSESGIRRSRDIGDLVVQAAEEGQSGIETSHRAAVENIGQNRDAGIDDINAASSSVSNALQDAGNKASADITYAGDNIASASDNVSYVLDDAAKDLNRSTDQMDNEIQKTVRRIRRSRNSS